MPTRDRQRTGLRLTQATRPALQNGSAEIVASAAEEGLLLSIFPDSGSPSPNQPVPIIQNGRGSEKACSTGPWSGGWEKPFRIPRRS